jgi:AraC-like DNA-binding protein
LNKSAIAHHTGSRLPLLGQATDAYQDRSVLPALQDHFARVWVHSPPVQGSGRSVIIPDGCLDLIWFNGVLVVAGPDRQAKEEFVPPGGVVVGLQFRPGAAASWLRVPVREIADSRVRLEDFWGPDARHAAEWIGEETEPTRIAGRLETAALHRLPAIGTPHRLAQALFRQIELHEPSAGPLMQRLQRSFGLSERTLRRLSTVAFGYGPKVLDRILRFQRFMRLAHGSDGDGLAELAFAAGYSDQPHLTREARRLSGLTPEAIRAQLRS